MMLFVGGYRAVPEITAIVSLLLVLTSFTGSHLQNPDSVLCCSGDSSSTVLGLDSQSADMQLRLQLFVIIAICITTFVAVSVVSAPGSRLNSH